MKAEPLVQGASKPRASRDPAQSRRRGMRRRAELAVIAGYVLELSRAGQASHGHRGAAAARLGRLGCAATP
jgi:hypothetical protein